MADMLPVKMALFIDWLFEAAVDDDVSSDQIHAAAKKLGLINLTAPLTGGYDFHPELQALIDNAESDEERAARHG